MEQFVFTTGYVKIARTSTLSMIYEICSVHIFSSIVKTRKGVEVPRRFETVESNIVLNQFLPLAQLAAADFPRVGSVSVVLVEQSINW